LLRAYDGKWAGASYKFQPGYPGVGGFYDKLPAELASEGIENAPVVINE